MEIGSEFFSSTKIAEPRALHRPKLLFELEPAYRVFFSNLLDALLFRSAPQVAVTSRPGKFWPDVFVEPEMPWWGFLESMLWHMLAVAGIWSISQGVALRNQPFQRPSPRRTYISYYRPSPTFPVAGARAPRPQPSPAAQRGSARQSALKVAREARRGLDASAPSLKLGRKGAPNLAGAGGSLPEMPFSATRRSRLNVPAGPNALVAPPPEVYEVAGRRGALPQTSVVSPPPDAGALASRRGLGAPGMAVVEPPPSVQGALRKFGDVNIGHTEVVAPAPRLPMHEQRAGVGVEQAGLGGSSSVVPPPPSIERSGSLRGGRNGSMAGSGMQIVPPPPSVQEAANAGIGRAGALSRDGVQIVPPPPSVEGVGDSAGRGRGTALTGNNFGVVPPAPSARDVGTPGGRGHGTSIAGSGLQVVPPPPSIDGVGNGAGRGRGTATSGGGLDVIPPAPSARGLGTSGSGNGRGGSLGRTGLQASGPGIDGQETAARGTRGGTGGSGKGSSAGAGTELASASGTGNGGMGGASGSGFSGHDVVNGSGAGKGGVGSGSSKVAGADGTAGGAGGSNGNGEGSGSNGEAASGGGNSGGISPSGSAAGSPNGSPTGSSPDGVNISGGGRPIAADIPRARPPILDNPPGPQDLPVRVIGLAMALPSSSYFSNYEVFIAERRVSKDESQLIKLVYVSLPYQKRLSEYGLNNRIFRLRVTRDPSCDESLMQMTWPDADQSKPGSAPASDTPELNSSGRNDKLPCYRTTADDYRKAISRRR